MTPEMFFKVRLSFTGIIIVAIGSLLTWNHYHGGIPRHHILARPDLPEISNLWGALLLPLLTWFLLYRVQKRLFSNTVAEVNEVTLKKVIYGFAGALFFGILLSTFFTIGYSEILEYMLLSVFAIALFSPIYRSECILGFVIGMTFTFGAVLPTGVGSILALISAVLYLFVRPAIAYVSSKIVSIVLPNKPMRN